MKKKFFCVRSVLYVMPGVLKFIKSVHSYILVLMQRFIYEIITEKKMFKVTTYLDEYNMKVTVYTGNRFFFFNSKNQW